MLLSDRDIQKSLAKGWFSIEPYRPENLQPSSYDVTLGSSFQKMNRDVQVDLHRTGVPSDLYHPIPRPDLGVVLRSGDFMLACTEERVRLGGRYAAVVEGKSSLGRLGLVIHQTAGFIDPGFDGQVTLELSNAGHASLILRPGMPIAQLCFMPMSSEVERMYGSPGLGSKYQHQKGATPPR